MVIVALVALIVATRISDVRYPITHFVASGVVGAIIIGYCVSGFALAFIALGAI